MTKITPDYIIVYGASADQIYEFGQYGDMRCCWRNDNFVDKKVSPMGFGVDDIEAFENLLKEERK